MVKITVTRNNETLNGTAKDEGLCKIHLPNNTDFYMMNITHFTFDNDVEMESQTEVNLTQYERYVADMLFLEARGCSNIKEA